MNTPTSRTLLKRSAMLSVLISSLIMSFSSNADPISSSEAGQKTMSKFMINLAKFVTWPDNRFAGDAEPYKYCLMGANPFAGKLNSAVADKQAKNRSFKIEELALGDVDNAKSCHVVFVNVAAPEEASGVIDGLAGLPILTVGEVDKFAQYGGMVGFIGEGRKVALAVNQKRLEAAGLKASSRLYRASTM